MSHFIVLISYGEDKFSNILTANKQPAADLDNASVGTNHCKLYYTELQLKTITPFRTALFPQFPIGIGKMSSVVVWLPPTPKIESTILSSSRCFSPMCNEKISAANST